MSRLVIIGRIHAEAHMRIICHKLVSVIIFWDVTIQNVTIVMARIEKSTAYDQF